MQNNTDLTDIRKSLLEGNTGDCIAGLSAFLRENAAQHADALQTIQVLEANYNATRTQELKGILTFQEAQKTYNHINDGLFALMRDLETGRTSHPASARRRKWWYVAAAALVVACAAALFVLRRDGNDCPGFEDAKKRVLILPFHQISGGDKQVAKLLQTEIQGKTSGKIPVDVKIFSKHQSDQVESETEVRQLVQHCGADLVIWGAYTNDNNQLLLATRHYVTATDQTVVSQFRSTISLDDPNPGGKMRSMSDNVFSICTVLAVLNHDMALATKWIEKTGEKTDTDQRIADMRR